MVADNCTAVYSTVHDLTKRSLPYRQAGKGIYSKLKSP